MLPEEYTGLMTNIMAKQLTIPSRQVCQEKSWKVGLLNTHTGKTWTAGADGYHFYGNICLAFVVSQNKCFLMSFQNWLIDYTPWYHSTMLNVGTEGLKCSRAVIFTVLLLSAFNCYAVTVKSISHLFSENVRRFWKITITSFLSTQTPNN